MVPWGRPPLGRWWDGSERNSTGGSGYPRSRVSVPCLCSRAARLVPRCCRSCSPRSWQRPPCPPSPPSPRPSRRSARRRSPRSAMRTCARSPRQFHQEGRAARRWPDVCRHRGERRELEPRLYRSLVQGPQLVQDQQRQRSQCEGPVRGVVRLCGTALFSKNTLYKKYAKCDDVSLRVSASTTATKKGRCPQGHPSRSCRV